eukprot:8560070-Alexandrium_andersonii.AAC.1
MREVEPEELRSAESDGETPASSGAPYGFWKQPAWGARAGGCGAARLGELPRKPGAPVGRRAQ